MGRSFGVARYFVPGCGFVGDGVGVGVFGVCRGGFCRWMVSFKSGSHANLNLSLPQPPRETKWHYYPTCPQPHLNTTVHLHLHGRNNPKKCSPCLPFPQTSQHKSPHPLKTKSKLCLNFCDDVERCGGGSSQRQWASVLWQRDRESERLGVGFGVGVGGGFRRRRDRCRCRALLLFLLFFIFYSCYFFLSIICQSKEQYYVGHI